MLTQWIRNSSSIGVMLVVASPAYAAGDLVLAVDYNRLIPLIVLFLLMIIPVNLLLIQPLLKVLDERADRISGTRARADQLEREATAILNRYEESVREVRDDAEQARRGVLETARTHSTETTSTARAEAEQQVEHARAEIATALGAARQGLRSQAETLAREAASQVLGRAL